MNESAVFVRDGERFVPGPDAAGPWGADRLHGGPVLGLIARAIEGAEQDADFVTARVSLDLFRPVPMQPLGLTVATVRRSSRLVLLQVSVMASGEEHARATALLLRASDAFTARAESASPIAPDGLPTESLMRGGRARNEGFHTRVETRWVPRAAGDPLAIWFRWPSALVEGERPSAFQCAVALSDFTNAIASIAGAERDKGGAGYINADATLYLTRRPEGEWFCLQEAAADAERGISVGETLLSDTRGVCGRVLQARLANRMR
jgi:hypothetical protein